VAKAKKKRAKQEDPVVGQLDDIKRLIMLQLIHSGVQANQIATVLDVTKSTISGMVPARIIKKREK
jgi:DNA-binding NarL/FixJ family response regulator